MAIFIIGLVAALVVASAYIALGALDFLRIRHEVHRAAAVGHAGTAPPISDDHTAINPARETAGFAWRAVGGVVTSVALLYAISHVWWAWYAFPALALGTGVAVSIAFVIDPTKTS